MSFTQYFIALMTLKILSLTTQLIVMSFKYAGNKIRANVWNIAVGQALV